MLNADKWIMSLAGTLLMAALAGGYTYASSVKADNAKEIQSVEGRISEDSKRRWAEHNQVLDRQLDQISRAQETMKQEIEKRNDKLEQKLDRLLEQGSSDWHGRSKNKRGGY